MNKPLYGVALILSWRSERQHHAALFRCGHACGYGLALQEFKSISPREALLYLLLGYNEAFSH